MLALILVRENLPNMIVNTYLENFLLCTAMFEPLKVMAEKALPKL